MYLIQKVKSANIALTRLTARFLRQRRMTYLFPLFNPG
jgi:hypothetical protein